MNIYSALVQH